MKRAEREPGLAVHAALGRRLRDAGYSPENVARCFCEPRLNAHFLDSPFWVRPLVDTLPLEPVIDLLMRGNRRAHRELEPVLGALLSEEAVVEHDQGLIRAQGLVVPIDKDLIWTDRPDQTALNAGGLFIPDSSTTSVRRSLPRDPVDRHLDIGSGCGAVTVLAARSAETTVALDINPLAAAACQRSAALNELEGIECWTGDAARAAELGTFDRVSFVLPLLHRWEGMGRTQLHTLATDAGLLQIVISQLPRVLGKGGIAVLYAQDWVDGHSVHQALETAFEDRPWQGAFWQCWSGETDVGHLAAGVFVVRADASEGWVHTECTGADEFDSWWWPQLDALLSD